MNGKPQNNSCCLNRQVTDLKRTVKDLNVEVRYMKQTMHRQEIMIKNLRELLLGVIHNSDGLGVKREQVEALAMVKGEPCPDGLCDGSGSSKSTCVTMSTKKISLAEDKVDAGAQTAITAAMLH